MRKKERDTQVAETGGVNRGPIVKWADCVAEELGKRDEPEEEREEKKQEEQLEDECRGGGA